jgi:long-chain acyl-CoA synthetase
VREFSTPAAFESREPGNLADDAVRNAREQPDRVAFVVTATDGPTEVTAKAFVEQVRDVAKGLMAAGVAAGDRVALLASTRYEWTLVDYAVWYAGAVTVPVYPTSSPEQVRWILSDSGARAAVVEHQEQTTTVRESTDGSHPISDVWTFDTDGVQTLTVLGRQVPDADLEARRRAVTGDSPATIVYTSGTTGRPKGCTLTHGNFTAEVSSALDALKAVFDRPDAATVLFMPLAHVFARLVQVGAVRAGVRLGYSSKVANLIADLESFRPTFVLAIPRVFEIIFNTASQRATADGRGRLFDRASNTAIAVSSLTAAGRRVLPVLRAKHTVYDRLVYAPMRDSLGGRCEYAISGGAPLGERLTHFYRGIGVTVLEGYGLTESTGAVCVNVPEALQPGTVGRPLGGTTVRVSDDGELLVRGGQVFAGYWNNQEATRAVMTAEGWLRTGDLGEIDDEGFVSVTGRKTEILVTAGGKNVAPSVLEDRVRSHALVAQCLVVGDGQPFVAALVTLDPDAVRSWAESRDKSSDPAKLVDDPDLRAEIQGAVDDANKAVSRAEAIRRFAVLPRQWTEEGGQLTPSLKLRRSIVLRESRDEVTALYGG